METELAKTEIKFRSNDHIERNLAPKHDNSIPSGNDFEDEDVITCFPNVAVAHVL